MCVVFGLRKVWVCLLGVVWEGGWVAASFGDVCIFVSTLVSSMDLMVWCRYGSYLGGGLGSSMKRELCQTAVNFLE